MTGKAAGLSSAPTLTAIAAVRAKLSPWIVQTPVWRSSSAVLEAQLGQNAKVYLKLELLQVTGSFKARGALNNLLSLDEQQLKAGVTAVSAGNHAVAVSYAASVVGTSAKVVMPATANARRVQLCKSFGAEVVLAESLKRAFEMVRQIESDEGRALIHPFEGEGTILGTATLGAELLEQLPAVDTIIVPVGGGGLAAGVAAAIKQHKPACRVIGVEPAGADVIRRSLLKGSPASLDSVSTIADSLGAPHAAPYSFSLCQAFLDDVVVVDDTLLRRAMRLLFEEAKLAVEPAGSAGVAALLDVLRGRFAGETVAVIVSGSNIDPATYCGLLSEATA